MRSTPITALRITLASPTQIRAWSSGEVVKPETINYLTQPPVPGGLCCERIFGPTKDWHCACGKYQRQRAPGVTCEQCGVEITKSRVRRERMGHIELAVPVAHPWFAKNTPSIIALLLNLSLRQLHALLSCQVYIVLSIDEKHYQKALSQDDPASDLQGLTIGTILEKSCYQTLTLAYGQVFYAATGTSAIRERLAALDLDCLAQDLHQAVRGGNEKKIMKQLHIVEALKTSGIDPSWMVLDVIPVLPPALRPLVALPGGRYASSDLNALYERVIHRNNRIKHLLTHHAPEAILNYEHRLLQEACDALFDHSRQKKQVRAYQQRPLKSLTDVLTGKMGRFRRNLLGKRVDYSARSVIVGDATLTLHQCGLPTQICLELFKPFLIRRLIERNLVSSVRGAKRMIERVRKHDPLLWDALEEVMHGKVVLLNRAPTLHRLSIQAFEIVRMDDSSAIRLHPQVCSAFNADFDGDQMAVHLPLSAAAQAEARAVMLSTRNLRAPASGEPAITITQEMVLGLFYLTQERPSTKSAGRVFSDMTEALLALEHGIIDIHTRLFVRIPDKRIVDPSGMAEMISTRKRIETTVGRLIFNTVLPAPLRFKNYEMTKERLKQLVAECLQICGETQTALLADELKHLGFRYATRSGISFSVLSDIVVPAEKGDLLIQADTQAQEVEEHLHAGMITPDERYQHMIEIWTKATEAISNKVEAQMNPWNSLTTIIKSGATKAKFQQIRQLSGIRGLMASPTGKIIAIPVRGNYLEGLKVWEIFIAASGARKGFMDRSLNTARSGYLTRKLVEAAVEVWITASDCGTQAGIVIMPNGNDRHTQLLGRVLAEPLPEINLPRGTLLDKAMIERMTKVGISTVCVRSPLTCAAWYGICQQCYGLDLATAHMVHLGTAVGIVAAQAIGEPGTQLTMRTFHSGGVAHAQGDITQGLPRIEELFDARRPKNQALITELQGSICIEKLQGGNGRIRVCASDTQEERLYHIPVGKQLLVKDGEQVTAGQALTTGHLDLQAMLDLRGQETVARYLVNEVQHVYRGTGVYIADKHIECIVRQMVRYVRIREIGDTNLLPGAVIDRFMYATSNAHILAQGGRPATAQPVLLGVSKAALQTRSWLAAASFQETSRVLTDAALSGTIDELRGFKEALILGHRIPTARTTMQTLLKHGSEGFSQEKARKGNDTVDT